MERLRVGIYLYFHTLFNIDSWGRLFYILIGWKFAWIRTRWVHHPLTISFWIYWQLWYFEQFWTLYWKIEILLERVDAHELPSCGIRFGIFPVSSFIRVQTTISYEVKFGEMSSKYRDREVSTDWDFLRCSVATVQMARFWRVNMQRTLCVAPQGPLVILVWSDYFITCHNQCLIKAILGKQPQCVDFEKNRCRLYRSPIRQ